MRLKSLTPKFVGPFMGDSIVILEPDVTVITGPNDSGKSLVLRAIEILCSEQTLKDHEINRYRQKDFRGKCSEDPQVSITAEFVTDEDSGRIQPGLQKAIGAIQKDARILVNRQTNETRGLIISVVDAKGVGVKTSVGFDPPQLLKLPFESEIRQELQLSKLNESEGHFVRISFGNGFSLAKHASLSPHERSIAVAEAQETLNSILETIFPESQPFSFRLTEVSANPELLVVSLVDQYGAFAPFDSRGSGVRRLMNVLGPLMSLDLEKTRTIILYDEPEISLHANMQHTLRNLLERIASHPNVQVIYTTHSPSMINVMRPESIRVVERSNEGGKAVSKINNNAYAENYVLVRSSLGISPSDSLLYSPFTIIVEGSTEVVCLPLVLRKLSTENGPINSRILNRILPQVHILDGEGDKFEYMCRLAKSQGAKPIIFLDGDKSTKLSLVRSNHPEVPIVLLDAWQEFEDLVPLEVYVDAAASALDLSPDTANFDGFQAWLQTASLPERMLTSKKVQRWLDTFSQLGLNKTRAMRKAVEACDATQINTKPFLELFDHLLGISGEGQPPNVSS